MSKSVVGRNHKVGMMRNLHHIVQLVPVEVHGLRGTLRGSGRECDREKIVGELPF